ncbi:MAG: TetR/AcrR family transcriptional regulator [Planctomycetes bacterium]|nr:TetR/AcrR family transcriptional regulator [Planctomycetota bacterium]MBI3848147.1 TetR/AcrR family transcriptional regulator [Planctomycetota bacterium]
MVRILNEGSKTVRKKLEILRGAAGAFRERGFEGAGMRDIAEAIGMAPGALYYYFKSKDDLLYFCQDYSLDRLLVEAAAIEKRRLPADEKLQLLIEAQLSCMLDELGGSAAHLEFHALPSRLLRGIIAKRDRYEAILRRIVEAGVRSRVFAPLDPKLVSLAILGAINWTIKWYRPGGGLGPQEIAETFSRLLIHGLSGRPTK